MASKQSKAMRHEHLTKALAELREASNRIEEARSWLFDLDHVADLRREATEAKNRTQLAVVMVARQYDAEFPDELRGVR